MDNPPDERPFARQAQRLHALARRIARLKTVPRTGWLDRDIDPRTVESVTDHSFGVALLAWACAVQRRADGANLDPDRVLKLALVHDLAEADIGDLTPYVPAAVPAHGDIAARHAFLDRRHIRDEARVAEKRAREDTAMRELLEALPHAVQSELGEMWEELRLGTSVEARFVKQVDRLETFLQSRCYLNADPDLPMESFRREVTEVVDDPLLAAIRDAAVCERSSDTSG